MEIEGCEGEERSVYDYTCLSGPTETTNWFSCSRNPQTDDCAHPGQALEWDGPVDHEEACEAHFGTLTEPGSAAASYPAAVGEVRAVTMVPDEDPSTAAWDPDCPVYACQTSYCRDADARVPPHQCGAAPSAILREGAGLDWSVPTWAGVPANSGYFGKVQSPGSGIQWAAASVGWRQLHPEQDTFDRTRSDRIPFDLVNPVRTEVLDEVVRGDIPYWLRVYTAAADWAPTWLADVCTAPDAQPFLYTTGYGADATDVEILPIWNECIWSVFLICVMVVLSDADCTPDSTGALPPTCPVSKDGEPIDVVGWNLRDDPELRMVYVPGAFRYVEYGLGAVKYAAA
ncbi:MAG: hypothetical protein VX000_06095, partial [Myxococcota bacterium]|nr:hypothetical protein [Myxococcota bacterium]